MPLAWEMTITRSPADSTVVPEGMTRNKQLVAKLVRGRHFFLLTQLYRVKNRN